MRRELHQARRLLERMERDLKSLRDLLERLEASESSPATPASDRKSKREEIPADPTLWAQQMEALWKDFQERGLEAVEAFIQQHTVPFLVAFLHACSIPIPGRGKPSKRQIREELYQRLRERRALERPVFTPRPLEEGKASEAESPHGSEESKEKGEDQDPSESSYSLWGP